MGIDPETALVEIDSLKAAIQQANSETQAVRTKLHNAVRKGRALEAEKQAKSQQIDELKQQLATAVKAPVGAGSKAQDASKEVESTADMERLKAENAALQGRVAQLAENQAQQLVELQGASKRSSEREKEMQSLVDDFRHLEDLLKAKDRDLAAKQGECVLASAALEAAKAEVRRYQAAQQTTDTDQKRADMIAEADSGEVDSLRKALAQLQSEFRDARQGHEKEEVKHIKEVEHQRQQITSLQVQAKQLQAFSEALEEAEAKEVRLLTELQTFRAASSARHDLVLKCGGLQEQLTAVQTELQVVKASEQRLSMELAEATEAIAARPVANELGDVASEGSAAGGTGTSHELEELKNEMAILQEAMQMAAERITTASNERDEAQGKERIKASEAAELRRKVAELEGTLSAEVVAVKEELHDERLETEGLKKLLRQTTAAHDSMTQRTSQLEAQLLEALAAGQARDDVIAAELAAAAAESAAAAAKAGADAEVDAARARQAEAARQIREAEAQVVAAANAAQAADERAATAEEAAQLLREEDSARRQRFAAVQQGYARKEATLQAQVLAVEQQALHHQGSMAAMQQAVAEAQKAAEAALAQATGVDQRIRQARAEVQAAAEASAEDASQLAASLQRKLHQAEAELAAARGQLQEHTHLTASTASMQAALTQSQAQAEAARAEAAGFQERVIRAESAADRARERLRGSEESAEKLRQALTEAQTQARAVPPESGALDNDGPEKPQEAKAVAGTPAEDLQALRAEHEVLRTQSQAADKRVAAASAVQHAKVAALEKTNQDLSWQVAMLAKGGQDVAPWEPKGPQTAVPQPNNSSPGKGTVAGLLGWVLRHRKVLLIAYLALLHILIYHLVYSGGCPQVPTSPSLVPPHTTGGRGRKWEAGGLLAGQ